MDPQNFLCNDLISFALVQEHAQAIPTNLGNGRQIWHALKVVAREIGIAPLPDLRHSLFDFYTKFFLNIAVLGQLPKPKRQLRSL